MADHFECLGLPRRFSLDAGDLERAYLARSRAVHPDFHLSGPDAQLGASVELTAGLNEAYTTLRDPFTRAEYLLLLEGGPVAGENRQMPSAFLAEMLEAREQVESARGNPAAITSLETEFARRYDELIRTVAGCFAVLSDHPGESPGRSEVLLRLRAHLNAAKYIRGLLRDLRDD